MPDVKAPMFFNVNHYVCVRLTPVGREVHARNHFDMHAKFFGLVVAGRVPTPTEDYVVQYRPPTEEPDGWSEWQAWDLMKEFGHAMGNGMKIPFETEIFIGTMKQLREQPNGTAQATSQETNHE